MTATRGFDLLGPMPTGTTVLEASAGTGKTYAIVGLAARYIAEGIAEISDLLLVTFSRAATQELRDRTRSRFASTARDLWTFGRMVMQGGQWQGRQLVPADYVRRMIHPSQSLNRSYGLLWWVNEEEGLDVFGRPGGRRFPNAPHDTYAALGAGGGAVEATRTPENSETPRLCALLG